MNGDSQGFVITDNYDQGNGPNDDIAVNRMSQSRVQTRHID